MEVGDNGFSAQNVTDEWLLYMVANITAAGIVITSLMLASRKIFPIG